MPSFPPAVRTWLAPVPGDLRKGFDALAELVRQHLRDDPVPGHVFVFLNRRGGRTKLLFGPYGRRGCAGKARAVCLSQDSNFIVTDWTQPASAGLAPAARWS